MAPEHDNLIDTLNLNLLYAMDSEKFFFPALGCNVTVIDRCLILDDKTILVVRSNEMIELLWQEYVFLGGRDAER